MKKLNKHRFEIENIDRSVAFKLRFGNTEKKREYSRIGNLGEIAAAQYLDIKWEGPHREAYDLIDAHNVKYQVKTVVDHNYCKRHWLQSRRPGDFDRYIFVALDVNEKCAIIERDVAESIPHLTSHICAKTGHEAIYRK